MGTIEKRVGRRFRLGRKIGRRWLKRWSSEHEWLVEFFKQQNAMMRANHAKYDYKIFVTPLGADVFEAKYKESLKNNNPTPGGTGE